MFFENSDNANQSAAVERFKIEGLLFAAIVGLSILISVFFRSSFIYIPYLAKAYLIVWFSTNKSITKHPLLYALAWGTALAFVLLMWLMESELGLSLFKCVNLLPLPLTLIALLGTSLFQGTLHLVLRGSILLLSIAGLLYLIATNGMA